MKINIHIDSNSDKFIYNSGLYTKKGKANSMLLDFCETGDHISSSASTSVLVSTIAEAVDTTTIGATV